jgi:putative FmdB family regulatory protein
MPLYEYRCDACAQRFEVIQKYSDPPPAACRKCGAGPVHRQHSSPAIQFKGSGWYVTDYASKSKTDGAGDSAPSSTGDSKPADSSPKSESTATSEAPTTAAPSTAAKD